MMTKQEEIREGIFLWMGAYGIKDEDMVKAAIEFFSYLHSQGVVIKVEGELPDMPKEINCLVEGWRPLNLTEEAGIKVGFKVMLKAGYTLTEPLIGDNNET